MIDETKSRLERARFQYENLLLHSGNMLLLATTPPRSVSSSPESHRMQFSHTKTPENTYISSGKKDTSDPYPIKLNGIYLWSLKSFSVIITRLIKN